jgi:hypothetical protein
VEIDMRKSRVQRPIRFRKARADASVQTVLATIEKQLGLPAGCVMIVMPSGRKQRHDATVNRLKKNWAV